MNIMNVLNFLFAFMSRATEAKINNSSKNSGFIHHRNLSHHARHLEYYDPGICADLYKAAVECQNNAVGVSWNRSELNDPD